MDKIDVVLFRYYRERRTSTEVIKMGVMLSIPLSVIILMGIVSMIYFLTVLGWILLGISGLLMFIWTRFMEAKWGPAEWKNKILEANRAGFRSNQQILIEIIDEEKLSCQQVYNCLLKKYNRIPQGADNRGYVITILSLVIALTGILVSPITDIDLTDYLTYVTGVFGIIIILGMLGYTLYRFVNEPNILYDQKKAKYEDVLELLEDWLY